MDLSLIGPDRRDVTALGRFWLTLADVVGGVAGVAVAVVALLLLVD